MPYCVICPGKKHASYGPAGGKPTHCSKHGKEFGFVNVINTRCEHDECEKRPAYGIRGERPTRCGVHKLDGMIDVNNKRCEHDECDKRPAYGIRGERPTRCGVHKLDGMIDVNNKRCEHDECEKRPLFGMPGERPTRCGVHKLEGMINVVNKRCEHDECEKIPSYGMPGKRPTHCTVHKLDGMIDVVNRQCEHDNCDKQPSFGIRGQRATHCADHKAFNMVDVVNDQCAFCSRVYVAKKGDYCATCTEWDENCGASRKTRQKERAVVQALVDADIPYIDYIHIYDVTYNKSIGKACGGYRPDILLDCGSFFIIVECDESQHQPRVVTTTIRDTDANGLERQSKRLRTVTNYDASCEVARMFNIRLASGVPCHFFRFNPDAFKIDGVTVRVPIAERHAALCDQVKLAISTPPSSDLVVTYLYYDDALLKTEIMTLPPGYVWTA